MDHKRNKDTLQYILSKTEKTNPIIYKDKYNYLFRNSLEIFLSESTSNKKSLIDVTSKALKTLREDTIELNKVLKNKKIKYEDINEDDNMDYNTIERNNLKDKSGGEIFDYYNNNINDSKYHTIDAKSSHKNYRLENKHTNSNDFNKTSFNSFNNNSHKTMTTKNKGINNSKINNFSTSKSFNKFNSTIRTSKDSKIINENNLLSPQKQKIILKLTDKIEKELTKDFNHINNGNTLKNSTSTPNLNINFNTITKTNFHSKSRNKKACLSSISKEESDNQHESQHEHKSESQGKNTFLTGTTGTKFHKKIKHSLEVETFEEDNGYANLEFKLQNMVLSPEQEKTVTFYDTIRSSSNPNLILNDKGKFIKKIQPIAPQKVKGVQAILTNNKKIKHIEEAMKNYTKLEDFEIKFEARNKSLSKQSRDIINDDEMDYYNGFKTYFEKMLSLIKHDKSHDGVKNLYHQQFSRHGESSNTKFKLMRNTKYDSNVYNPDIPPMYKQYGSEVLLQMPKYFEENYCLDWMIKKKNLKTITPKDLIVIENLATPKVATTKLKPKKLNGYDAFIKTLDFIDFENVLIKDKLKINSVKSSKDSLHLDTRFIVPKIKY